MFRDSFCSLEDRRLLHRCKSRLSYGFLHCLSPRLLSKLRHIPSSGAASLCECGGDAAVRTQALFAAYLSVEFVTCVRITKAQSSPPTSTRPLHPFTVTHTHLYVGDTSTYAFFFVPKKNGVLEDGQTPLRRLRFCSSFA